jgi:coenzyme F420-dependent glucose-6-phosphate dehydrogenase
VTRFACICAHEPHHPEALLDQAVRAESSGFEAIVCSDLFHPWTDDRSNAGFRWA